MAKIELPSYIKAGHGRMQDAIITSWKGIAYMRPYKKMSSANPTENQQSVRRAFMSLVSDWKYLTGIIRTAWDMSVEGQSLTGYNAYVGANLVHRRTKEPIKLCPPMGEEILKNFSVQEGANTGEIACSFAQPAAGKHVTFFIRKESADDQSGILERHDCGANARSPVTLESLEARTKYTIYAVVTDSDYTNATTISESAAAQSTAKA